jgi:DNA-binding MarR family transcriptional regulator
MPAERNALIADMRRFNRFYTSIVRLLDETLTHSAYTLAEARVLFELARRPGHLAADPVGKPRFLERAFHLGIGPAASAIAAELQLDPAYATRILRKFAAAGLTELRTDPDDQRRRIISLTACGKSALAGLEAAADRDLARLTSGLSGEEAAELSDALARVRQLFGDVASDA